MPARRESEGKRRPSLARRAGISWTANPYPIPMKPMLLPLAAVVIGGVIYQLAMKAVPKESNPFAVLAAAYGLATAVCTAAMYVETPAPKFSDVTNWPVLLVA